MLWWIRWPLGVFLMDAELVAFDVGFHLVFVGLADCAVGLIELTGIGLPIWAEYLAFSVLAGGLVALFREKVYARIRRRTGDIRDPMFDSLVDVSEDLAPGHSGRVSSRGSRWTAYNADTTARVIKADGLVLHVVATSANQIKE